MKTTYRIAIAELRSLFCSPVAWLILVIFAAGGCGFWKCVRSSGTGTSIRIYSLGCDSLYFYRLDGNLSGLPA